MQRITLTINLNSSVKIGPEHAKDVAEMFSTLAFQENGEIRSLNDKVVGHWSAGPIGQSERPICYAKERSA